MAFAYQTTFQCNLSNKYKNSQTLGKNVFLGSPKLIKASSRNASKRLLNAVKAYVYGVARAIYFISIVEMSESN